MYGTYLRLGITVHDGWRTVVRAAARKLKSRARRDPTLQGRASSLLPPDASPTTTRRRKSSEPGNSDAASRSSFPTTSPARAGRLHFWSRHHAYFTIEATYRIPVYRQRSYEAGTLAEACRLAVEDDDWEGQKETTKPQARPM